MPPLHYHESFHGPRLPLGTGRDRDERGNPRYITIQQGRCGTRGGRDSQRACSRNLMAVRSSPSIMTLVNAGMVTRSMPLGATNPRVIAIALTAWFTAPAPTACNSTDPLSRSTAASAPATALGFESAPTLSTSGMGACSLTAPITTLSIGLPLFRMPTTNSFWSLSGRYHAEFRHAPRPPALAGSRATARSAARSAACRSDAVCATRRPRTVDRSSHAVHTSRRTSAVVSAGSGRNRPTPTRCTSSSTLGPWRAHEIADVCDRGRIQRERRVGDHLYGPVHCELLQQAAGAFVPDRNERHAVKDPAGQRPQPPAAEGTDPRRVHHGGARQQRRQPQESQVVECAPGAGHVLNQAPPAADEQIRADDGLDCPGGPGDAGHAVQSLRLFRIAGQHHDLGLGGTGAKRPDDDSEYRLVAALPESVIS